MNLALPSVPSQDSETLEESSFRVAGVIAGDTVYIPTSYGGLNRRRNVLGRSPFGKHQQSALVA